MRTIILFTLFGAGLLRAATMYAVVDLGTFGGSKSVAYHINNGGAVVGWSQTPVNDNHAFSSSGGAVRDLNQTAAISYAYGNNLSGQTVGSSFIDGQSHGSIWSGAGFTDLGAGTYALSINGAGAVAGGDGHAFVYNNGAFTGLGALPGGNWSAAYGINDSGEVAGYGTTAHGFQAFTWTAATGLTTLGTLGGRSSYAMAINNQGQVVGHSTAANGYEHAFIENNGALTDIGTLGGGTAGTSYAYGINNAGAVVGYSGGDAFLYGNGTLSDLNSLIAANNGWQLQQAYSINDSGKIVGTGLFQGQSHAFELDPVIRRTLPPLASVPEPGSITLFALGLSMLAVTRVCKLLKNRPALIRVGRNP